MIATTSSTIVAIHTVDDIVLKATHRPETHWIEISYNGGEPFTFLDFDGVATERNIANAFVDWCESLTKHDVLSYIL